MSKKIQLYKSDKIGPGDRSKVEVRYKDNEIKIIYIFPAFTLVDAARTIDGKSRPFQEVNISGTGFYSVDSEPLLPSFGRLIQIPAGYGVADAGHRRYNLLELEEEVLVTWAEETVADQGRVDFDEKAYGRDEFIPKENVVVHKSPYYADGYKVILVRVRPLQYNPRRKRLRGYGKIIVTIALQQEKMDLKERALANKATDLEGFGNLLLNPKRKVFDKRLTREAFRADILAEPKGPEFLIVYGEPLEEPAKNLKNWKIKCGIDTAIKCIDEIPGLLGTDAEGVQREKLKQYLRQIREKPFSRLRYVLLLGDVNMIPVSQKRGANGETTDHYFYTNKDADNSECILPWISGGRIPVENEDEGLSVVDQIISYERNPPRDSAFYKRMTVAGYFEDCELFENPQIGRPDGRAEQNFIKTMEDIRDHMISLNFNVNRVYFSKTPKNLQYRYRDGTVVPQAF